MGRMVYRIGARPMIKTGGFIGSLGFILLHLVDSFSFFVVIFVGVVNTVKSAGLGQKKPAIPGRAPSLAVPRVTWVEYNTRY